MAPASNVGVFDDLQLRLRLAHALAGASVFVRAVDDPPPPAHDPFGAPTRPSIDPADFVRRLADLGAYGAQDLRFGAEDLKEALAPEGSGKSLTIGTRLARSTTETSGWTSSPWSCCWALAETAV